MSETPQRQGRQSPFAALWRPVARVWGRFAEKHPGIAQFAMFFIISNGVTALQLALMPFFRWVFSHTGLLHTDFQVLPVGTTEDGATNFIFNYPAGEMAEGGAGGLAYFLAVQITILIAQVINFFAQRSITFKSNSSIWKAAFWYALAYVIITFVAAAAQGIYRAPLYDTLIGWWGSTGETTADVLTMIINAAIQFWVFYPIFKLIFRQVPDAEDAADKAEEIVESAQD
ncbi:hypothetical protein [Bogoriella caseilytica]|uniref:GtrA-like protein n=1 Tax=Bogoriella caseilytica TaxID=56055 RepID=A0A3N2BF94_9MICO|nr:hypothetical protein [Bogoriella caseilytica]ROR73905.1 hypothetical protein EDD31_2298 [Bogoriella caseilytica]